MLVTFVNSLPDDTDFILVSNIQLVQISTPSLYGQNGRLNLLLELVQLHILIS